MAMYSAKVRPTMTNVQACTFNSDPLELFHQKIIVIGATQGSHRLSNIICRHEFSHRHRLAWSRRISMEIFDAIRQRRSVKHYDPAHRMSAGEIETLLEAAVLSPTSFNIQHWRFVVVADPALRAEIRAAGFDQSQITDASLLLVVCADVDAWKKDPHRYWAEAPDAVAEAMVGMMGPFHEGREQLQRDEAMRSIGIVMQTLMLAAKGMGLDSSPMIGFEHDKVAELINLPDGCVIGPMLAIGKKTKDANPRAGQLPLSEILFTDRFA
jgi:nitroreductase